jgi:chemotaxis protein methyltransferase CheR
MSDSWILPFYAGDAVRSDHKPWQPLAEVIGERLGLDVRDQSETQPHHAIDRLVRTFPAESLADLARRLKAMPEEEPEWSRVVDAVTVKETCFFRDGTWTSVIADCVLAPLIARHRALGRRSIRIWSAGCATGEEPYTIAILLDRLLPERTTWSVSILGTDVSRTALEWASRGRYREWSLRHLPTSERNRHFRSHTNGSFELNSAIRDMVRWLPLNLVTDEYPAAETRDCDLIICRNVLMYFPPNAQKIVARRLAACLAPGGVLSVTAAEASADMFGSLNYSNQHDTILFSAAERNSEAAHSGGHARLLDFSEVITSPEEVAVDEDVSADTEARQDAADLCDRIEALPVRAEPSLSLATELADRGDYVHAREVCRAVIARDPLDGAALLLLARICYMADDELSALETIKRALYVDPHNVHALFLSAVLHDRVKNVAAARIAMSNVISVLDKRSTEEPNSGDDEAGRRRMLEVAYHYLRSRSEVGARP